MEEKAAAGKTVGGKAIISPSKNLLGAFGDWIAYNTNDTKEIISVRIDVLTIPRASELAQEIYGH
eukprot:8295746-Ditylum_brightwellii.AAC.1